MMHFCPDCQDDCDCASGERLAADCVHCPFESYDDFDDRDMGENPDEDC